jgi:hypothetical protein
VGNDFWPRATFSLYMYLVGPIQIYQIKGNKQAIAGWMWPASHMFASGPYVCQRAICLPAGNVLLSPFCMLEGTREEKGRLI